jgi:methyl-accepting chemotaxis protein
MNSLKIGVRLGLGFGIVLLMLVALGVIALKELSDVNDDLERIVDRENLAMNMVGDLNLAVSDQERLVRSLVLYDDDERQQRVIGDLNENDALIDEQMVKFEALMRDLGRSESVTNLKRSRNGLQQSIEELIARFERGQVRSQLVDFLESETRLQGREARNSLRDIRLDTEQAIAEAAAEARATYDVSWTLIISLTIAAVIVGIALSIWITRSILGPIQEAVAGAIAVSKGDLSGNLRSDKKDETGQLLNALADMRDSLREIVTSIREGVDTINTASGEIATGNTDLSQRTEEQASNLEETAASMEELTSTVKQNADNAKQANTLARTASENADRGGDVVDDVVKRMADIREGSRKMSEIITVIDGIAFQTNILALNAAVEAARAGEQGRGFAVVATEVRSLAQRSASAAKDIKSLIETSVDNINTGGELADKAGNSMDEIVASIKKVTDIIGEISAASDEQSAGIEQINQAVSQMDQVTQQNAALVEESAAAAESLQSQAEELEVSVGQFKLDSSGLSATGRAPMKKPRPSQPSKAPGTAGNTTVKSAQGENKTPAKAHSSKGSEADDDWEEF